MGYAFQCSRPFPCLSFSRLSRASVSDIAGSVCCAAFISFAVRITFNIPAAIPKKKNSSNNHGPVPNSQSRPHPSPPPATTAETRSALSRNAVPMAPPCVPCAGCGALARLAASSRASKLPSDGGFGSSVMADKAIIRPQNTSPRNNTAAPKKKEPPAIAPDTSCADAPCQSRNRVETAKLRRFLQEFPAPLRTGSDMR